MCVNYIIPPSLFFWTISVDPPVEKKPLKPAEPKCKKKRGKKCIDVEEVEGTDTQKYLKDDIRDCSLESTFHLALLNADLAIFKHSSPSSFGRSGISLLTPEGLLRRSEDACVYRSEKEEVPGDRIYGNIAIFRYKGR